MNDLPPKTVKAQLVRLDDNLKRIERTQVAGIQRAPGSLPVLEAFQLFLETERRKARRRIMALTAGALLMMMAAAAVGVVLVRSQMRTATDALSRVSVRTEELAAVVAGSGQKSTDEIAALENRFSDESRRIVEQYTALVKEQATLGDQDKTRDAALETLQQRLDRLESENELLKTRLTALTEAVPTPAEPAVKATGAPIETTAGSAPVAAMPTPEIVVPPPTPAVAAVTGPVTVIENPSALLMTITPEGGSQGIRWQLPRTFIPE
jgi:hypothetical protein